MKLPLQHSKARSQAGIQLIECLVYIAIFAMLLAGGTMAFFYCWNHTRAVVFATDQIESALRAGEIWRADVRAATGRIAVENTSSGRIVHIPRADHEVVYIFDGSELRREISGQNHGRQLLSRVKVSEMKADLRDGVVAWHWDLELQPQLKETTLPLRFTFAAAQVEP